MRAGRSHGMPHHQVMLLDDDQDMLDLLSVVLEKRALSAQVFTNPSQLFEALQSVRPSIVVTDLQIDEEDGMDVCRRLTEDYPEILCVVLSGDSTRRHAALRAGADLFLLKPISSQLLVDALLGLVRHHKVAGDAH